MSLWIIAGVMLIMLLTAQLLKYSFPVINDILIPLVISVVFSLVSSIAYSYSWCSVAKSSETGLTKFYLVASMLRMMAALLVELIAVVVMRSDKKAVLCFTAVFVVFYIVLLVFDCIYFSRKENKLLNK